MLSPQALERTTHSYRRGYKAGYFGEASANVIEPDQIRPFGQFDYDEGYAAGANDRRWDDERSARRKNPTPFADYLKKRNEAEKLTPGYPQPE